jgi:hypothetical protein
MCSSRQRSSFLPQDKVSEFARMTPVQLLRETQRTAGDKRLTEWHDTLIDSGKQMREVFEVSLVSHVRWTLTNIHIETQHRP